MDVLDEGTLGWSASLSLKHSGHEYCTRQAFLFLMFLRFEVLAILDTISYLLPVALVDNLLMKIIMYHKERHE